MEAVGRTNEERKPIAVTTVFNGYAVLNKKCNK